MGQAAASLVAHAPPPLEVLPLIVGGGFPRLRANAVLLRLAGVAVVVDCGARSDRPALLSALAAHGTAPEAVEWLLLTHLHFDHCENIDLFPNARVVVHRREVEWLDELLAVGDGGRRELLAARHQSLHEFYLRSILRQFECNADRYRRWARRLRGAELVDGRYPVLPGVALEPTPGHSPGHLSVDAGALWVAGDAVSSRGEWLSGELERQRLCADLEAFGRSQRLIAEHAEVVIPGHGEPFRCADRQALTFEALAGGVTGAVS